MIASYILIILLIVFTFEIYQIIFSQNTFIVLVCSNMFFFLYDAVGFRGGVLAFKLKSLTSPLCPSVRQSTFPRRDCYETLNVVCVFKSGSTELYCPLNCPLVT